MPLEERNNIFADDYRKTILSQSFKYSIMETEKDGETMRIIGVDGGGTSSKIVLLESGKETARTVCGPLNYRNTDPNTAVANLLEGLSRILPDGKADGVGVGDPSIDDRICPDDQEAVIFEKALRGNLSCPVFIRSDAYLTLFGETRGSRNGIVLISGTGAMALAERVEPDGSGIVSVAGGWGRAVGDEGSGYSIAFEALQAVCREADGYGPKTRLTEAALGFFGVKTPRELIRTLYGPEARDIASFSETVGKCAESGDLVAGQIIGRTSQTLISLGRSLADSVPDPEIVVLYGSVLEKNAQIRKLVTEGVKGVCPGVEIRLPRMRAETAAALYAERELTRERNNDR